MTQGKLRPALVVGRMPGSFDDWLICMISSQTRHLIQGFDDLIAMTDADFSQTGLKTSSVIRVGRLAVVDVSLLLGQIGSIDLGRLTRIKSNLANWLHKK